MFWKHHKRSMTFILPAILMEDNSLPLNLITQRLFALDHGTQAFGNMLATVSTGHGLSVIPMRLGVPPEIVVVSVEPIKK